MTVKEILTPVINQEIQKYERNGQKIKLKSVAKKRTNYTIICGIVALLGFAHPVYLAAIPIYIILMMKTRNYVDIIIALAKKNPDMPIDRIIAQEVAEK